MKPLALSRTKCRPWTTATLTGTRQVYTIQRVEERQQYPIGDDDEGRRLDRVLRIAFPGLSLASIFSSLRKGVIRVNGSRSTPDYVLRHGDIIDVPARFAKGEDAGESGRSRAPDSRVPGASLSRQTGSPSSILSDLVVLSTENLLFLNKPRGMLVHGAGSLEGLVLDAHRSSPDERPSLAFRPGPLHRLDRNTSGLVTFPRTARGARSFSERLRERRLRKFYLALLEGRLDTTVEWEDILNRDSESRITRSGGGATGRRAYTRAVPLVQRPGYTFACLEIGTGFTHQIRAQSALHGFPLSGDEKYGGKRDEYGYFLHSWRLVFPERPFPDVPLVVTAEPDARALRRLTGIFGNDLPDIGKESMAFSQ